MQSITFECKDCLKRYVYQRQEYQAVKDSVKAFCDTLFWQRYCSKFSRIHPFQSSFQAIFKYQSYRILISLKWAHCTFTLFRFGKTCFWWSLFCIWAEGTGRWPFSFLWRSIFLKDWNLTDIKPWRTFDRRCNFHTDAGSIFNSYIAVSYPWKRNRFIQQNLGNHFLLGFGWAGLLLFSLPRIRGNTCRIKFRFLRFLCRQKVWLSFHEAPWTWLLTRVSFSCEYCSGR